MTSSSTVNLLDFDAQGLVAYCESLGEKPFRAKQLQRWIHQYNAADFDVMTDLAKSLREKLKGRASIGMPDIISDNFSTDGTRKWLVDVGNGNAVETVFIPEETRGTLCVSSQAGCASGARHAVIFDAALRAATAVKWGSSKGAPEPSMHSCQSNIS